MAHRLGLALALLLCGRSVIDAQTPVTLGAPMRPVFVLRLIAPERVKVGDPVALRIQIVNSGDAAHGGRIRVDLGDALQHAQGRIIEADLPSLRPGESRDIDLSPIARQGGPAVVAVQVRADNGQEVAASVGLSVTGPALEVYLTGPAHRSVGREAKFDLAVYNRGSESDQNVIVTAVVPVGLELVSADGGAYDAQARQVRWSLGTLVPQRQRGLTLHLLAQGAGSWTVQAAAAAAQLRSEPVETILEVDAVPALLLEVVDSVDPLAVGVETEYEVRVLNRGSTAATHLQVIASASNGLTPLDADGPTRAEIDRQQVIFTPLPKLAAGAETVYRIQVRGTRPGDGRLTVQLCSDQLRIPLAEEESTRVFGEEAQVGKGP